MDAKLQRRVQRYGWDKAAAHYERFWAEQLAPAQRLLLDLASLAPGEHVLDIAQPLGDGIGKVALYHDGSRFVIAEGPPANATLVTRGSETSSRARLSLGSEPVGAAR